MSDPNEALFAPQAPAGLPEYQRRPPTHPLNPVLPVVAVVGSALYVLLCAAEVYALAHRAAIATSLANGTGSVTAAQAQSADSLVSTLNLVAVATYLVVLVVYVVWTRSVRTTLAPTGRGADLIKQSGYMVFRGLWLVSLLLGILLNGNNGTADTPQQLVSHDHEYMVYFGLRALVGVALAVFVVRFRAVSTQIYRESLAVPPQLQPFAAR